MEIGKLLKQRRLQLKLTLEEVGNAVGVGKSTVKKWEDGYIANMKRDKIASLASVLKISPALIMGLDKEDYCFGVALNYTKDSESNTKPINIIKIAGRDGSYLERILTDDQLDLLKKMIEQLPEAEEL